MRDFNVNQECFCPTFDKANKQNFVKKNHRLRIFWWFRCHKCIIRRDFICKNLHYVIQLNPDQKGCHTKLGLKQRSPSMMLRINRTQGRQQLIRKLTTI